jgi:hypothetical protein
MLIALALVASAVQAQELRKLGLDNASSVSPKIELDAET